MSSKQPRKQRKALYNAPLHKRQKLMAAKLSSELQEEFGRKSLSVRKGDVVRLMRGGDSGHEGKVEGVDLKAGLLKIEGVTVQKADATDRFYMVHPSNVEIIKADMKDDKRTKIIERQ